MFAGPSLLKCLSLVAFALSVLLGPALPKCSSFVAFALSVLPGPSLPKCLSLVCLHCSVTCDNCILCSTPYFRNIAIRLIYFLRILLCDVFLDAYHSYGVFAIKSSRSCSSSAIRAAISSFVIIAIQKMQQQNICCCIGRYLHMCLS